MEKLMLITNKGKKETNGSHLKDNEDFSFRRIIFKGLKLAMIGIYEKKKRNIPITEVLFGLEAEMYDKWRLFACIIRFQVNL